MEGVGKLPLSTEGKGGDAAKGRGQDSYLLWGLL